MRWTAARRIVVAMAGFVALAPSLVRAAEPHMEELGYLLAATAATYAQIEAGRLAVENAESEQVREFAKALLEDHEQASEELASLAEGHGVEPVEAMEPETQRWLDRLRELDGSAFDAVYVVGEVPILYTADWIYEREALHGMDQTVRAQAERRGAANDQHQSTARRLAEEVAGDLPDGLHPEDDTYLPFAMNVDLSQVRLGELAVEKAEDERVRAFARRMVEDHGRSLDQFSQAAEARGVALLEEPGPVTEGTLALLEQSSGRNFDWDYITSQVIQHYQWFYRHEHETIHGRDAEVQTLAAAGTELVKMHHDAVLALVHDWTEGEAGASAGAKAPQEQH